jgi:ADP-ribosylglycohydrolase
MRYSISSRFRGTILGLAIGENLGKSSSVKQYPYYTATSPTSTQPQPLNQIGTQNLSLDANPQIVSMVILGMRTLIQKGKFVFEDWRHAFGGKDLNLGRLNSSSAPELINIIATLPIALFYHENKTELRQNLQLAMVAVGQDKPDCRDGALALGYAIALCVQAKLNRSELISQTIAFLGEPQTQVAQKLLQVRTLLEQNAGLERAVTALDTDDRLSSHIALAFYSCLSTAEDFRLSVKRAAAKSAQPQFTSAMTGALSGAYNGISSIPATLRLPLSGNDKKPVLASGMTTKIEMLKLCDALVGVWSGVYDRANQPADLTQIAAIAAPRVMRRR